ncbi:uncharacterized protein si:ch73-382f3.1 [Scophthalmus maximus]|uniref:uncharacterized protein si:ch73-382f3.1 n=1 Tax=Scophthalmus maximus TaxID=52904 RepID=UPI0015E15743|nr:uncharacterized protein si:ch73-382f3.1 [Scophthalmus maximus]
MGGCSAPNCSNSTRRGKQLFRFPRDPFRNKKWVKNCRRQFEPDSASRLCQDHFEQSQFEEIAKTAAGGKKLKPHAVPTLFRFRDRPYRAGSIPIAPYPPYATYAPIAPYILQPVKPEPAAAMGGCSAPNCSNSTNMGKQLFRFPKDPVRNKKWVMNSRREFEPTSHSRLCQDHFEQSQFEEIARSPAGGKKLKPNAIPTLFSCGDPLYPAVTTPYILLPLKPEPVEKELNIGDHGYARRTPLPGMEEYDADWSVEGRQPCTQCHLLQTLLEHEMQHTARLQKEAEEMKKRLYRLDRLERGLQNFLYEDQIRALSLTKRSRRAVWSPETILKARKIRCAVGFKGYEYLRELGYPLPTYRTLCNRLETKITVRTDMSCEELAELGLGLVTTCDSRAEGVGDNDEEELAGVLS